MNFSKMKKLSKRLSLVLVIVMLCALFAGCKKEEPSTTDPSENMVPGLNLNDTPSTEPSTTPATTEPTKVNENMGTVTQQMNIRGTPSMQAAILGTLYAGDKIEVIRQEEVVGHLWGYIQAPEDGWVVMDYVEMDVPSSVPSGSNDTPASSGAVTPNTNTNTNTNTGSDVTGTKGVITGNGLNIRSEPTTGKIQGSYNKGDVVTILETKDGWGRTDKGWIKMDFVNLSGSTPNANTNTSTNTNTNTNNNSSSGISGDGSTTVVAKGVVKVKELNLRSSASTDGDRLGSLKYGDRVEILEKSGSWGRTSKGWIHMDYIYQDGTKGANRDSGTVTGNGLNIRSGPGTGYGSVGSYNSGDRVDILEQFTYGNTTWGCTSKGWISLAYVDLDNGSSNNNSSSSSDVRTGIVTRGLNIRDGAGTAYEVIGQYEEGDRVAVLETRDGWGRTEDGWISLNYVDFGGSNNNTNNDTSSNVTRTGTVTTGLYVRDGAGTNYDVVSGLEAGDHVTILETRNGWGRIDAGWISMNYVDLD